MGRAQLLRSSSMGMGRPLTSAATKTMVTKRYRALAKTKTNNSALVLVKPYQVAMVMQTLQAAKMKLPRALPNQARALKKKGKVSRNCKVMAGTGMARKECCLSVASQVSGRVIRRQSLQFPMTQVP